MKVFTFTVLLLYYSVSESSVWVWVWNRAVQGGIIWARVWGLQEEGCSNTAVLVQSHALLTVTLSGEHRGHHHSQLVLQGLTNTLIATDFHLKWLYFGDLREMFYHWPGTSRTHRALTSRATQNFANLLVHTVSEDWSDDGAPSVLLRVHLGADVLCSLFPEHGDK